jgi:threonine dehydrogenase-like Zn-dependent dehydrogenase
MKAITFNKTLELRTDYPRPAPEEGEALVRVRMAGICNTDLEITRGYMGFKGVLGHEFVGVVEASPGDGAALIGRRVVGEINCVCG